MTIKLKPSPPGTPAAPFSWDDLPSSPPGPPESELEDVATPPMHWLDGKDMRMFGSEPLRPQVAILKCKDCGKPILESAMADHVENCLKIRNGGKKGAKGKAAEEEAKKGKKRKAEDEEPDDPNTAKKKKAAPKVTKGRFKGPVDYDKQCGVINDKGLPCSRSLTCKSHSMGAKRAVQGRSRPYDDLLLEWNRLNKPNFVEPVKRESKQERKDRKEKEKADKKKEKMEAAAAMGTDLNAKKPVAAVPGATTKKAKKPVAMHAAIAAPSAPTTHKIDHDENLDDVDSEAEMDSLIRSVHLAHTRGVISVPLAVPCDASSWFVARRERVRTCREHLANALMPSKNPAVAPGVGVAAPTRIS